MPETTTVELNPIPIDKSMESEELVRVEHVRKFFPIQSGIAHAEHCSGHPRLI